jgi:alpha-1,6-mannosyltransferase
VKRVLGGLALLGLVALAVPLAAPGGSVVPASGLGDSPGWLLGVFGDGLGVGRGTYFGCERAFFVLYLLACLCATALPLRMLKGVVAVLVLAFTLAPPLLSLDVFSYISYARLEVLYDLNPYRHVPLDRPGDEVLQFIVRWRDITSAYGPLFTLGSLPLGEIGAGAALWTAKAAMGAATLGLILLTGRMAPERGVDPRTAIAFVGLNPLVLVHVVGGPHNDALMMLLATAAVAALLAGREATGGAGLVAAAAVKVSAGFIAPFALIGSPGIRRGRFLAGAAGAGLAVAVAAFAVFGGGLFDSLQLAGENQSLTSRHSFPVTLAHDLGLSVDTVRVVALAAYGAFVLWLLRWTWLGGDWIRAAGWAGLGLLLATAYLTPWYTLWILPLAALGRDRALIVGAAAFTGYQLLHQVPL